MRQRLLRSHWHLIWQSCSTSDLDEATMRTLCQIRQGSCDLSHLCLIWHSVLIMASSRSEAEELCQMRQRWGSQMCHKSVTFCWSEVSMTSWERLKVSYYQMKSNQSKWNKNSLRCVNNHSPECYVTLQACRVALKCFGTLNGKYRAWVGYGHPGETNVDC